MVPLPLHPRPPPPPPFSSLLLSRSSSSPHCPKLWLSDALPLASSDFPSGTPSAVPTRRVGCSEGRYGVQALPITAGTCRLGLRSVLPSHLVMAPSVRCSPELAPSQKRLCKVLEFSSYRPTPLLSESNQILDLRFRVSAVPKHNRSELSGVDGELTDNDGLHKRKGPIKIKSAEELHFEAVEDYCRRYENYGYSSADANKVHVEADAASIKDVLSPLVEHSATSYDDASNTPISESKYSDASRAVLLTGIGRKQKYFMQANPSLERAPIAGLTSFTPTIASANDGLKNSHTKRDDSQLPEVLEDMAVVPNKNSAKSDGVQSKDNAQEKKPNQVEWLQTEESQLPSKDCISALETTNSDGFSELNEGQKIRMELNKAAAVARRNLRVCEDAVAEAQANGLAFPKFESLLVEKSWFEALKVEFQKPYMERLYHFVSQEAAGRIPIYPPPAKLFNAFNSCPFDKVKVVIIGQDPYHGPGQAMGLCFSVEKGTKLPSSLRNIFLEIQNDLDCDFPTHGNLEKWAYQGVLLLNTVLTVRDRHANSHAKKGWEIFTDAAIRTLAQQRSGVVFLLWGNQAQDKLRLISKTCHHILKAFHPSGISAHRGFFQCRHFSQTNKLLVDQGLLPIDWEL